MSLTLAPEDLQKIKELMAAHIFRPPRRKPLRYKPSLVSHRVVHHPRPVKHLKP